MNSDRGMMKWQPFKTCEEVFSNSQRNKVEKPILFEEQLEEFSRLIVEAYINKSKINVSYYEQNNIYNVYFTIKKIDSIQNTIMLENGKIIHFNQITNVN